MRARYTIVSFFFTLAVCFTPLSLSIADDDDEQSKASLSSNLFKPSARAETEIISQIHGDLHNADLILFMAGNQFVTMDQLVYEFQRQHPSINHVAYVTIPPGQLLNWTLAGGINWQSDILVNGSGELLPQTYAFNESSQAFEPVFDSHGNKVTGSSYESRILPDVYTTVSAGHMTSLNNAKLISSYITYAHNRLVLMADVKQLDAIQSVAEKNNGVVSRIGNSLTVNAKGLYEILSSNKISVIEPDIFTQGIERHIWQMYTETTKLVADCASNPGQAVCQIAPKDFPDGSIYKETCSSMRDGFFANEDDASLRKIVYGLKRLDCENGTLAGKTLVTSVHHIETPVNIKTQQVINGEQNLVVGPVWATEIQYQNNRLNNPDIVGIEISDTTLTGKALNRRDTVNYLGTLVEGTVNRDHKSAAKDFLRFLHSTEAQRIFEYAGFEGASPSEQSTTTYFNND